jgi:NTP pyrophosphatase (non-canonical NTP hydrolase)
MAEMYLAKDSRRGLDGTFMYFVSEVGELAQALRDGVGREEEFADALAWLLSVANLAEVDLQHCFEQRYLKCPHCSLNPCICKSKP